MPVAKVAYVVCRRPRGCLSMTLRATFLHFVASAHFTRSVRFFFMPLRHNPTPPPICSKKRPWPKRRSFDVLLAIEHPNSRMPVARRKGCRRLLFQIRLRS
jgi:hypothetical protein